VGKLVPPPLENSTGLVTVIPKAFNKSSALAVLGADRNRLEKTSDISAARSPISKHTARAGPRSATSRRPGALSERRAGRRRILFPARPAQGLEDIKDRDLEPSKIELLLPKANPKFEEESSGLRRRI